MNPVSRSPIPLTYLDTDGTLAGNSDVKVATQKATKTYADTKLAITAKATGAEITTGTEDAKFATPKAIKDAGITPLTKAAGSDVTTGTDDAKYVTAKAIKDAGIGAGVALTASPSVDHTGNGIKITLTAGADLNFGDVVYIKSDGKAGLIDADAIATMSGVAMCVDASIANNAAGNFIVMGVARDDTWNWTVGGLIYGSTTGTTGNTLTQTAPTGTDDVVQVLGVALTADIMLFSPQLVQVELV